MTADRPPKNPPLEWTPAAVYFTCGRASRVRRRGRSTALRYPALGIDMTRDQLIGTWRCKQMGSTHELRPDGSCLIRTTTPNGQTHDEQAEWEYVDAKHWKLRLIIAPDPNIPGLEDGAVEGIDYEITSEQPNRMSLMQFDVEFPWEWEKAVRPAG